MAIWDSSWLRLMKWILRPEYHYVVFRFRRDGRPMPGIGSWVIRGALLNPSGCLSTKAFRLTNIWTYCFNKAVRGSGLCINVWGAKNSKTKAFLVLGKEENEFSSKCKFWNLALSRVPVGIER